MPLMMVIISEHPPKVRAQALGAQVDMRLSQLQRAFSAIRHGLMKWHGQGSGTVTNPHCLCPVQKLLHMSSWLPMQWPVARVST